jgi:hypothetical protein
VDVFRVVHRTGLRAARFLLRPDVPWLAAPETVLAEPGMTTIPVVSRAARFPGPGVYVGSVTAYNASDTIAGPLFRLASTVVVPYELRKKPLLDEGRPIRAGGVQRYFLRAGTRGSTLHVTVVLPDSLRQSALVNLYEPNGQPFRDGAERAIGDKEGGTARFAVRAEDLVPGVYELDVIASPSQPVTVSVSAEVGPLSLAGGAAGTALEAANSLPATVRGQPTLELVGAERTYQLSGRGAPPETLFVRVPEWAATAEVNTELSRNQWSLFTDFALTVFDTTGRKVAGEAMDYAYGRLPVPLAAEHVGQRLTIELFPAYAWSDRTPAWRATVTVRFLLPAPRRFDGGDPVSVVPGGRVQVPLPAVALEMPDGFRPLLEASLAGSVRRMAGHSSVAAPAGH